MNKKLPAIVIVVVIAAGVVAGVWFLQSRQASEEKPDSGVATSAAVTPERFQAIVGRWRRPDGGYIIDIRGLDSAGNPDVAYYNPRPINVSRTQVVASLPDTAHRKPPPKTVLPAARATAGGLILSVRLPAPRAPPLL